MIILQLSDFNKKYSIAQSNNTDAALQECIDDFEASSIKKILGVELGTAFIAALAADPTPPLPAKYVAIRDAFIEQSNNCKRIYESKGMKDALAAIVYYEYVSNDQAKHTQSGVVTNASEVSNIASPENAERLGEQKYNEALDTIWAIQWKCENDKETYPDYKGIKFSAKYSSLL